jgi:hypothetical protein
MALGTVVMNPPPRFAPAAAAFCFLASFFVVL